MDFTSENYILVPGFATREYGLSGNEALLYGVIHGFSQDGDSQYNGTIGYLAKAIGATPMTVRNCIDRLIEKGLITKYEVDRNGVTFCEYAVTRYKNFEEVYKIFTPPKKFIHNNNIVSNNNINISNNKDNNIIDKGTLEFVAADYKEIFSEWLTYKAERKEKYKTERSLRACYTKLLNESHNNPEEARLMIRNAMGNNYAGFFPLKPNELNDARNNKKDTTRVPAEVYQPEWDDSTI